MICLPKNLVEKFSKMESVKILVATSGGVDSMCLLHFLVKKLLENNMDDSNLLKNIDINIGVFHLNHMLREDAKEDYKLVERVCDSYGISFFGYNIDVLKYSRKMGLNFEMCARTIRYNLMACLKINNGYDFVATAHHMGDQAESVFMNMMRGAGIKGLSAMSIVNGSILRPFLDFNKEDILNYAKRNNVEYRDDYTNFQSDFKRNKIRNELFDLIEREYQHDFIKKIYKTSRLLSVDSDYLDKVANEKFSESINCINPYPPFSNYICKYRETTLKDENIGKYNRFLLDDYSDEEKIKDLTELGGYNLLSNSNNILLDGVSNSSRYSFNYILHLDIHKIQKNDYAILSRIILKIFEKYNGNLIDIGEKNILDIYEWIINGKTGTFYEFKGIIFEKRKNELIISTYEYTQALNKDYAYKLNLGSNFLLHLNINIRVEECNKHNSIIDENNKDMSYIIVKHEILEKLCLRNRRAGDYIRQKGMNGSRKKIKKVMNELSLPQYVRSSLPLLALDSEVLWIANYMKNTDLKFEKVKDKLLKIILYHC